MTRWRQATPAALAGITVVTLLVANASEGDWGFIAVVVGGNVLWFAFVAILRRINPSKDPADYR